jgi:hypothetical protein
MMRFILASVLLLGSCARLELSTGQMTPEQMLQRSTHVFIGVIQKHEFPNPLLFRVSGEDAGKWKVLKRSVRVETVLRGEESRPVIDVYEAFPTGVISGAMNLTQDNHRYLFPVRLENGRYHLVQDFLRSIYPIYSGRHNRLPLDESRPFWERFALLQWWVQPDRSSGFGHNYSDPEGVFGKWRRTKVLRGLLRHPDGEVRLAACEELINMGGAQDECWDSLDAKDRETYFDSWSPRRAFERNARGMWDEAISTDDADELRLFTTINNRTLRREFCAKFQKRYPHDSDNGCPADRPPPATIVTKDGDIPLIGEWPVTVRP